MALVGMLCQTLGRCTLKSPIMGASCLVATEPFMQQVRFNNKYKLFRPVPNNGNNYRFKVHYPEDGVYTVKPLKMTKLAGRDPETGRIIHGCLGGGAKRNYRWIDFDRRGPTDGTFLEERVLKILYDPNRTAKVALVGVGDKLKYRIATDGMEVGDLIRSSSYIPRIAVRPNQGDAYPIGALPMGTQICCIAVEPNIAAGMATSAGSSGLVKRKMDDKVVVQMPSKREFALDPRCMATVGRVSNPGQASIPLGSAQRYRWFGNRPRSGLWQRKTGYQGRKIKPLPPVKVFGEKTTQVPFTKLNLSGEDPPRSIIPCTKRVS